MDRYNDLNCLDLIDAKAITKQKIYDCAVMIREQRSSMAHVGPFGSGVQSNNQNKIHVLCIQTADEHMTKTQQDHNGNLVGPITNGILDVVNNELRMDCHYIANQKPQDRKSVV